MSDVVLSADGQEIHQTLSEFPSAFFLLCEPLKSRQFMSENPSTNSLFPIQGEQFPKSEKLCNVRIINQLFAIRKSEFVYPFKIVYLREQKEIASKPPQILISVSKRNFKKAVTRNRIKRQIREIYRKNRKDIFTEQTFVPHYLAIIFIAKKQESFGFMEDRLCKVLRRISQKS